MRFLLKCSSLDKVYCPKCGSKNIVALNKPHSHCGHCGSGVLVEFVEKESPIADSALEDFVQVSLFNMT